MISRLVLILIAIIYFPVFFFMRLLASFSPVRLKGKNNPNNVFLYSVVLLFLFGVLLAAYKGNSW
jgi:hypothetical protein